MATTAEKAVIPGGGDYYSYINEMKALASSLRTVVPVTDITEADTIATAMAADGRAVSDTNPLVVWDNSLREYNVKNASGWANTPWQTVTLINSWVAYVGGGGYYSGLKARKKDGKVLIHGMIKSGAVGSIFGNLPAGYYPNYTGIYVVEANVAGGWGSVVVSNTDGSMTYRTGPAAPAYVNIDLSLPLF